MPAARGMLQCQSPVRCDTLTVSPRNESSMKRKQWIWVSASLVVLAGAFVWAYKSRGNPGPSATATVATTQERGVHGRPAGYVDPKMCAGCHAEIYRTYQKSGMRRSFFQPRPENTVEDYTKNNTYFHKASASYYKMLQRDGKYFQRRWQLGPDGKETNVEEKQIDYVVGSGNHVRVYVHRTPRNT